SGGRGWCLYRHVGGVRRDAHANCNKRDATENQVFHCGRPEDVFLTQGGHWWLSLNYEAFWSRSAAAMTWMTVAQATARTSGTRSSRPACYRGRTLHNP